MEIAEVFDLVRADLDGVEAALGRQSESAIEPVARVARYLQSSGGKRLRPTLHLLAAGLCGYQGGAAIRLGAVLELVHTATLVHDDVIDDAATRRGRASANRRWGNSLAVLAGDWIYMEAFRLALEERSLRILDILTELTQMMVEGELIQLTQLGRARVNEAEALDISRRKTACLFSTCLRLGAVLGKRPPVEEELLARYGLQVGMAFQIVDDLLDFIAEPERLGKPVVNDLREGKVTLPLVYALEKAPAEARRKVETVLEEKEFRSVKPEEIIALVRESGAVERSRARAAEFLGDLAECLDPFPESSYKRALESLPHFVLHRDY
ncbi:MAG: polyprenyl synthetase family protein [Candidatus Acidiferrales bacterium]